MPLIEDMGLSFSGILCVLGSLRGGKSSGEKVVTGQCETENTGSRTKLDLIVLYMLLVLRTLCLRLQLPTHSCLSLLQGGPASGALNILIMSLSAKPSGD